MAQWSPAWASVPECRLCTGRGGDSEPTVALPCFLRGPPPLATVQATIWALSGAFSLVAPGWGPGTEPHLLIMPGICQVPGCLWDASLVAAGRAEAVFVVTGGDLPEPDMVLRPTETTSSGPSRSSRHWAQASASSRWAAPTSSSPCRPSSTWTTLWCCSWRR